MTHVLAKELRGRNITVNAVAPGPTATMLFLDGKPKEVIDHLTKLAPLEWIGEPAPEGRRGDRAVAGTAAVALAPAVAAVNHLANSRLLVDI
jgi:NAD(P)-dependent dehydrogenase (short-subunit alcohol dehydrogenase family)